MNAWTEVDGTAHNVGENPGMLAKREPVSMEWSKQGGELKDMRQVVVISSRTL